jgi:hypothetical protein
VATASASVLIAPIHVPLQGSSGRPSMCHGAPLGPAGIRIGVQTRYASAGQSRDNGSRVGTVRLRGVTPLGRGFDSRIRCLAVAAAGLSGAVRAARRASPAVPAGSRARRRPRCAGRSARYRLTDVNYCCRSARLRALFSLDLGLPDHGTSDGLDRPSPGLRTARRKM